MREPFLTHRGQPRRCFLLTKKQVAACAPQCYEFYFFHIVLEANASPRYSVTLLIFVLSKVCGNLLPWRVKCQARLKEENVIELPAKSEGSDRAPEVTVSGASPAFSFAESSAAREMNAWGTRSRRLFFWGFSLALHVAVFSAFVTFSDQKKCKVIEVCLMESPSSAAGSALAAAISPPGNAGREESRSDHAARRKKAVAGDTKRRRTAHPPKPGLAPGPAPKTARTLETSTGGEGEMPGPEDNGQTAADALPGENVQGNMPSAGDGHGGPSSGSAATKAAGHPYPLGQYLRLVRDRIDSRKQYPPLARRRRLEGRVGVCFLLTKTGEAQRIEINRSSGQRILDQAALKAVRNSPPFPRPPAGLLAEPIAIELNIVFNFS